MYEEFTWLNEEIKAELGRMQHVSITFEFSVEADRWHWGYTSALVRRSEFVIERETRDVSHCLGFWHSREPIVRLDELAGRLVSSCFLTPVASIVGDVLILQRPLGYVPHMDFHHYGSGLRPFVEYAEVRRSPSLYFEHVDRQQSQDPVKGRRLYRPEGLMPPDVVFCSGEFLPLENAGKE